MRIVVTGGAGYLGSVLCAQLLARGDQVVCLDKLLFGEGPVQSLRANPNFTLIAADLLKCGDWAPHLAGADAVLHLAGLANDPSCELDAELTRLVNLDATLELARLAQAQGVRRFVFASSCSVYGAGVVEHLDENSPLRPVSRYGELKAAAEEGLFRLRGAQFHPVALRQATLYGSSPRMRFDLAVNLMTMTAVREQRVNIVGGGNQWRPFLHVADAARAFIACLAAPEAAISGQVINLGSDDQNHRIADLGRLVAEQVGGASLIIAPSDKDTRTYRVDFSRVRQLLPDWRPERSVADGVREVSAALTDGTIADPYAPAYFNIKTLLRLLEIPVREGGEPVRPTFLPYCKPAIGPEEKQSVLETLDSGWLTMGPKTVAFERQFADYCGCRNAVAVSSCTAALQLCLAALGVGPGDEVITSPVTWPATANVVIHQGARPVFVDVEPDTLNLDPSRLAAAITPRTKAIIPVHMGGRACDLERIHALAGPRGIAVIEDAAHAAGAAYRGRKIGGHSRAACFSFYPIKNMTAGEGGMVTTDDDAFAEELRILRLHGVASDAWKRYSATGFRIPETIRPGFKANMTDLQAAIGIEQLKKLDGFVARRRVYAGVYDEALASVPQLQLLAPRHPVEHGHHLYVILLNLDRLTVDRDAFVSCLQAENIGIGIHFVSLHLHRYYRETFGYKPEDYPVAADVSRRLLSLPLYPGMTTAQLEDVIQAVKKLAGFYAVRA